MSVLTSRFEFAPSPRLAGLIAAGGAVACAAVLIIPIPLPLRVPAAAVVAGLFARAARRQAFLRGKRAVGGLEFNARGMVMVLDRTGNNVDMGRVVYAFVSPALCTAVVEGGYRRYAVAVMGDSLPEGEMWRHLRVRLRSA